MITLPATATLLNVARRVVWYMEPADALADPVRFLAHAMTWGTPEDVAAVSEVVDIDVFREVLETATPGIFDARSWAYWNLMCGRDPAPPLPTRKAVEEAPAPRSSLESGS
jgi:hypothetical protein